MPLNPPPSLVAAFSALEETPGPIGDLELQSALRRSLGEFRPRSLEERRGAWAEISAFHFVPADDGDRGPWNTYFRPMRTALDAAGAPVYSPDAAEIDDEVLAYWSERASHTPHPLLRARYADLVWDFSGRSGHAEGDQAFAWLAFDAYLDTVQLQLIEHEEQGWRYIARAIAIARELGDRGRLRRAKAVLFEFFRGLQKAGHLVMWWKPDDIALATPELELGAGDVQEILVGLEQTLARFSDRSHPERFDPNQTLAVAKRLLQHRIRLEQPRQAARAMRTAGLAVEAAAVSATAPIALGWLVELTECYRSVGMAEDAARTEALVVQLKGGSPGPAGATAAFAGAAAGGVSGSGAASGPARGPASAAATSGGGPGGTGPAVPAAPSAGMSLQDEEWLARLVEGSLRDTLLRLGGALLLAAPADDVTAPLPRPNDSARLAAACKRLRDRHAPTARALADHLIETKAAAPLRREFIETGFAAWLQDDPVKAIYLLLPELQAARRAASGPARMAAQLAHVTVFLEHPSGPRLALRLPAADLEFRQLSPELANWTVHALWVIAAGRAGT